MAQSLAAHQHSSLVQLPARFIFAASIHLALVAVPGALVYPVIGNVLDFPGIGFIDHRGILGPVSMNVSTFVNVLPHLFLCRCVTDPLYDLPRIWPDDGA